MLAQVDVGRAVEQGLTSVAVFVPKLLACIAILVVGWIVARVVRRVVAGVLARIGFDRAVERGGLERALARSGYDPSDLLARLVFYTVMLFVLQLAVGVFGPNPISALLFSVIAFLPKIFVAIIIVVLAAAIAAVVRDLVDAAIGSRPYGSALASAAGAIVLVVGVFAALDQIDVAPAIVGGLFYALLAAVVGVAVVAIGGGGVQPMRKRWEVALARLDEQTDRVRDGAAPIPRDEGESELDGSAGPADVDEENEKTQQLPTVSPGATGVAAHDDTVDASTDPDARERQRPTPSELRRQLEEAGWPAFDDG